MPNSVTTSDYSRRSTPTPTGIFDPFVAGDDHMQHSASTSIIKLEDSGKVFCPLCLETTSAEDIDKIEDKQYHQYVENLFEALDQHGEKEQLRRIVLTILEIILSMRKLHVKRDSDFHDLLRIIYKIMKSYKFNMNEFSSLSRIFAGLSIESVRPMPLKSAWQAWEHMLNYGEKKSIELSIHQDRECSTTFTKFNSSLSIIIKTYLGVVTNNARDQLSDLVFPLYIRESSETISRKYYVESQARCLRFVSETLISNYSHLLSNEEKITDLQEDALSNLFDALRESFLTALRLENEEFIEWMNGMDFIARIHSLIYKNPNLKATKSAKEFLKTYVLHYIEKEYGSDEIVKRYRSLGEYVTTFAKQAIEYSGEISKCYGTIFYILINAIAIKMDSNYFIAPRVRTVIVNETPAMAITRSKLKESRTLLRAYLFVVASSFDKVSGGNIAKRSIRRMWREMQRNGDFVAFKESFCFEEQVFSWAQVHSDFVDMFEIDAINYLLSRATKQGRLGQCLTSLLHNGPLKILLCQLIKSTDTPLFKDFVDIEYHHNNLITEFGGLLPVLIHETLLKLLYVEDQRQVNYNQIIRLISAMNLLLTDLEQYNPFLDDHFLNDIIRLVEKLYTQPVITILEREVLIAAHELIACTLRSNNPSSLKLLKLLNFSSIGYLYDLLSRYQVGDKLVESAATVLAAYDSLDYPLVHRIENSLYTMSESAFEWMISSSNDLHVLSLILVKKIFSSIDDIDLKDMTKACLTTGFIHMLCQNPHLAKNHPKDIVAVLKLNEFKFHPLRGPMLDRVPKLKKELESDPQDLCSFHLPPSPDLSFDSTDNGLFDEEKVSVTKILDQLQEDENFRSDIPDRIPKSIYLSKAIEESMSMSSQRKQ